MRSRKARQSPVRSRLAQSHNSRKPAAMDGLATPQMRATETWQSQFLLHLHRFGQP
jgi:hypothetical protein